MELERRSSEEDGMHTKICLIAALMFSVWVSFPARAETWRWTDPAGVVHFTDDRERIPAQYLQDATVVEGDNPVNVIPDVRTPRLEVPRLPEVPELPAAGSDRPEHLKKRHTREDGETVQTPTTPAREEQNRAEERIRRDRQSIDDARLPARRALDQADDQIRKAREKTMGH
jgi:hypothetical protein